MRRPLCTVSECRDGASVRVAGTIRSTGEAPLTSKLGGVACVYWDIRDDLEASPGERGSQAFWLEDATGRLLVRATRLEVDARAERRRAVLGHAERELNELARRLREIKDRRRAAAGREAQTLLAEQRRLARITTLVCTVRAHARQRVHGKGTLESQARWIRANASLAEDGLGAASTQLALEPWEVVLCEGQQVEVEGTARLEPAPPGGMTSAGYRAAATVVVLGDDDATGCVRVAGQGAIAPLSEAEKRVVMAAQKAAADSARARRGGGRGAKTSGPGRVVAVAGLGTAVLCIVAAILEALSRS